MREKVKANSELSFPFGMKMVAAKFWHGYVVFLKETGGYMSIKLFYVLFT